MAIDERRRLELADAVKGALGDEAGLTLMEMLPPVGWADIATKQDLDGLRAATKQDLDGFRAATKQDLDGLRTATKQDLMALEERIDLRFALVDQRFDAFQQRIEAKFDAFGHELRSDFRGELVALTWRYIGAMGALFVAFSALMTLVIKL